MVLSKYRAAPSEATTMNESLKLLTDRLPAGFVTQPYPQLSGTMLEEDKRLVERNPAPNATQPLVPTSPTISIKIGS